MLVVCQPLQVMRNRHGDEYGVMRESRMQPPGVLEVWTERSPACHVQDRDSVLSFGSRLSTTI